jgi:hypothetical protein
VLCVVCTRRVRAPLEEIFDNFESGRRKLFSPAHKYDVEHWPNATIQIIICHRFGVKAMSQVGHHSAASAGWNILPIGVS